MRRLARIAALTLMATLAVACAGPTSSGPSGGGSSSPQPTTQKQTKLVNVDAATAARLQNIMVPLLKVMDHPLSPSQ
ncbi:MAG TPA: hypothetical protein VEP48_07860, partial [Methylomirabilota bacterium]|nr:hypothetical protein [Methylomirabilota bacterium]